MGRMGEHFANGEVVVGVFVEVDAVAAVAVEALIDTRFVHIRRI